MTGIKFDKLLKLADALEHLPHYEGFIDEEAFKGSTFLFDFRNVRAVYSCGSVGCAIGYTPNVFPEEVTVEGLQDESYFSVARRLFNLPPAAIHRLFTPTGCGVVEGSQLLGSATAQEVAANIREFVEEHRSQPEPEKVKAEVKQPLPELA